MLFGKGTFTIWAWEESWIALKNVGNPDESGQIQWELWEVRENSRTGCPVAEKEQSGTE